jgi:hypothetical protein
MPKNPPSTNSPSINLHRPARPDYRGGRNPTAHSIMHGAPKNSPTGQPNMDKPPNTPQGPHTDSRSHNEKLMRAAQIKGELKDVRDVLDPPIGEHMQVALQKVEPKKQKRMEVLVAHRLARSDSLDRHEQKHAKMEPGTQNTEEHLKSLQAASDLNPYSTTHHLGNNKAPHKHTKAKAEAHKTYRQAYDKAAVTATTKQNHPLREEYEAVHKKRAAVADIYLNQTGKPPSKRLKR